MATIRRADEAYCPDSNNPARVKLMGNHIEVRTMGRQAICPIKKIDANTFIELKTGELREFAHTESRAENKHSIAKSLANLRDLLNTNITDTSKCLWITCTYKENMTDTERLYNDYKKFNQRLKYYIEINYGITYEYIVCVEPQGRGAWHTHSVILFNTKAPYLNNDDIIAPIWRHGFTKTKSLKGVDNPGLYLTSYLANMELSEAVKAGVQYGRQKIVTSAAEGEQKTKAIVKGGRLHLYPPGIKLFRASRGIKRPETVEMPYGEAMEYVGTGKKVFDKTVEVLGESGDTVNIIRYERFNMKPKE